MFLKFLQTLFLMCFISIAHAVEEEETFDEHPAHDLTLTSLVVNLGNSILLHDPNCQTQIWKYALARCALSTTSILTKTFQNYLPTNVENWLVENQVLSSRNLNEISKNTAWLSMQTFRMLCYMHASRILSQETCNGVQGDLSAASVYLLLAGVVDFVDTLKRMTNKSY